MQYTLIGVYIDPTNADEAVTHLRHDAFDPQNLSVMVKDAAVTRIKMTVHDVGIRENWWLSCMRE